MLIVVHSLHGRTHREQAQQPYPLPRRADTPVPGNLSCPIALAFEICRRRRACPQPLQNASAHRVGSPPGGVLARLGKRVPCRAARPGNSFLFSSLSTPASGKRRIWWPARGWDPATRIWWPEDVRSGEGPLPRHMLTLWIGDGLILFAVTCGWGCRGGSLPLKTASKGTGLRVEGGWALREAGAGGGVHSAELLQKGGQGCPRVLHGACARSRHQGLPLPHSG